VWDRVSHKGVTEAGALIASHVDFCRAVEDDAKTRIRLLNGSPSGAASRGEADAAAVRARQTQAAAAAAAAGAGTAGGYAGYAGHGVAPGVGVTPHHHVSVTHGEGSL
jgi:hypothetical protein